MDKELKKKLKEYEAQIIREDKMKKRFINSTLDYRFIEYLIEKANADNDLICDITTNEGHRIVIRRERKGDDEADSIFDGEAAIEDR